MLVYGGVIGYNADNAEKDNLLMLYNIEALAEGEKEVLWVSCENVSDKCYFRCAGCNGLFDNTSKLGGTANYGGYCSDCR